MCVQFEEHVRECGNIFFFLPMLKMHHVPLLYFLHSAYYTHLLDPPLFPVQLQESVHDIHAALLVTIQPTRPNQREIAEQLPEEQIALLRPLQRTSDLSTQMHDKVDVTQVD
jgi:hypothetical protein